jgi:hypothetical protein
VIHCEVADFEITHATFRALEMPVSIEHRGPHANRGTLSRRMVPSRARLPAGAGNFVAVGQRNSLDLDRGRCGGGRNAPAFRRICASQSQCRRALGEALKETGGAELMADALTVVAAPLPAYLAPMLYRAAIVPRSSRARDGTGGDAVAKNLGLGPDAFLMAVAYRAARYFLTPIGRQNSTLVMGPRGCRFGDYWRGWGCRCRS